MSRVLRVLRFRLAEAHHESLVSRVLLRDLLATPGVDDAYGGRRDQDERILASIWTDRTAMIETVGESIERSPFHPELLALSKERDLSVCDLEFGDRAIDAGEPSILRLFEGTVRADELGLYVDEARRGTSHDRAVGGGPLALYLGRTASDSFMTLSLWRDWATLQEATGGDISRPVATRHSERLVAWTASHYEVLVPE